MTQAGPTLCPIESRDTELEIRLRAAEREIASLSSEILERYEEVTLVYRLSANLGSDLSESAISRRVIENAVDVLGAESGEIWLRDADGETRLAAVVPESRGGESAAHADVESVLRDGQSRLREPASDRRTSLTVPLPGAAESQLGALVLLGRDRPFRSGDEKLLLALASLASAFIRNLRLAAKAGRTEARSRENEIARQIHRSLLPQAEARFPGLELAGACRAAENIGGDYYGYVALPDGSLAVVMADVSAHGVGAAIYMAATKGAIQAEARRAVSPADLLRHTNEALAADFASSDVFATAFIARFHPGVRRLEFANGGHNPPLLVRASGTVDTLEPGGTALGATPDLVYEEESRELSIGDVLLIYTDGIVEARDGDRRQYGLERLTRRACEMRHAAAAEIRDAVLDDLRGHCGSSAAQDDVTLVVARVVDPETGATTP